MTPDSLDIFGGNEKWRSAEWTSSDDRVRGGKSQSFLDFSAGNHVAKFYGNLDIQTLGGAGFASQRTASEDQVWDLSLYDGVQIVVKKSDSKSYTFNIKDEILPKNPENGQEQSTISYEYDFQVPENATLTSSSNISIPWDAMKPTYRGREKSDAAKLNTTNIRRFGIMMRSFFGEQEGPFSLQIESITAIKVKTNESVVDQSGGNGARAHISTATKEDKWVADSMRSPAQPRSVHETQKSPTISERSTLKTVLLTLLGFSAVIVLFVRLPGAPATGWATIASCVRRPLH